MSDKYFLDTNIFVYAVNPRPSPKKEIAQDLIARGLDSGDGIVSYQVVQEFFSLAFSKFPKPLSAFEADEYLNTIFRPMLAVHSSPALFVSALQVFGRHRLSWYESLIVAAAKQGGCSTLYSEDMHHSWHDDTLRVENPFR